MILQYIRQLELELYSSVCNFVSAGTDENGENWYMTNNNQFTVIPIGLWQLCWQGHN